MRRKKFLEDCIGEADTFKVLIYKQSNNNPTLVRIKNQPNWNFIGSLEVLAIVTSDLNETSTSNTKDIDQRLSESITEELNQALPDTPKEIENNKNLETTETGNNNRLFYYIAIAICLLLISLPTTELNEPNYFFLPEYFTLTVSQKNVLYLVLGYLTATLVR